MKAIDKRTLDKNEEFILNAISCITNVLFYDVVLCVIDFALMCIAFDLTFRGPPWMACRGSWKPVEALLGVSWGPLGASTVFYDHGFTVEPTGCRRKVLFLMHHTFGVE